MKTHRKPKQSMNLRTLGPLLTAALLTTPALGIGTLTFDTDAEGFTLGGAGADNDSVEWSSYNGGSLKITVGGGWKDQIALKDIWNDPVLGPEIQLAATNGGTLSYTIYMEPGEFDITDGAYPNWFQVLQTSNSANAWDQEFNNNQIPGLGGGDFPLAETRQIQVTMDIEAGAPEAVGGDGRVQLGSGTNYHELFIGLNSENSFTTATFYVDDLTVEANQVAVTTVPSMQIEDAQPGLNLVAAGNGQYERRMIRNLDSGLGVSWVGNATVGNPVTYSFEVADYPEALSYTAFLYFIPDTGADPYTDPDWQAPTAARLSVQYTSLDPMTATADFAYKIEAPNSNGPAGNDYFTADSVPSSGLGGLLASVDGSGMTGTWSLSFTSDTDFTITAPDGTTGSGSMLQQTADLFAGDLFVYLGILPATPENIGKRAVMSEFGISGVPDGFTETFELNISEHIEKTPADRSGVEFANEGTPCWVSWSLPATGFMLQESPDLGLVETWIEIDMERVINVASQERAYFLVDIYELFYPEAPTSQYFRLERPDPDPVVE